ncbi:FAD-binding oxidoreductase [uncultured Lacinutrix sp.]|uniref:NAD(P)/FAD-dependent oxidoreductase n=1 Tax=uncultured Lacinutrix sp. TaxID=574032 RepID=UPI0026150C33|nr:FAD-dependent oxidoreductase [uncultured Lacinutrix sp.]
MKVDYIVVGCGIAGINFCEELIANNKTFLVFDNKSQQASTVAGGLYNPVTLKRFTPVWNSKEQLEIALPVYSKIEKRLNKKIDFKIPVFRRFTSLEEQNDWFAASDKVGLSDYMSTTIHKNDNEYIDAKFGFGEVLHTGRIDTKLLISEYKNYLQTNQLLIEETFEYDAIERTEEFVVYKNYKAKHIVFAEGFGVINNPFFNYLPLVGSKGELLTIHSPNLKLEFVLKSSVFVIPLGNDLYRIGSTYNWKDKTNKTTPEAREELLNKFKTFTSCDFEVVNQVAGIRPTVQNRRPLAGTHNTFNNYHVLNGLGTRGVMIGPYVAKQLYDFIENKKPLDVVIDIKRFNKTIKT